MRKFKKSFMRGGMMKIQKGVLICFTMVVGFLSSLYSESRIIIDDPHVVKQQMEDAVVFDSLLHLWKKAIEKYSQKNAIDFKIKCKNCAERFITLCEFSGGLLAWIIKAIPAGHDEFEKIKTVAEAFIKLLSDDASAEELINFMLNASNDMKQVCTHCHGVVWEKAD